MFYGHIVLLLQASSFKKINIMDRYAFFNLFWNYASTTWFMVIKRCIIIDSFIVFKISLKRRIKWKWKYCSILCLLSTSLKNKSLRTFLIQLNSLKIIRNKKKIINHNNFMLNHTCRWICLIFKIYLKHYKIMACENFQEQLFCQFIFCERFSNIKTAHYCSRFSKVD